MDFRAKLNVKFIGSTVAVLAVIFVCTSIYSINNQKKALESYTETLGNSIAETVANFSLEPLLIKDYPILAAFVERLVQRDKNIAYITVTRDDGQLLTSSQARIDPSGKSTGHSIFTKNISVSDTDFRLGVVVVAISTARLDALVKERIYESIWLYTLSFLLLSGIIYFLIKKIVTDRLENLAAWAAKLGQGRLDVAENIMGSDEISDLAHSFNEMRVNLKNSYQKILSQNNELIRLGKTKDEFLSNMSHELRTPLNAIIGYSEIIAEDIQFSEYDEMGSHASKVRNAGLHLLHIVNDLLDLTKLDSGSVTLQKKELSLASLVEDVLNIITPNLHGNRLQVLSSIEQDRAILDGHKIKQILINLLSNACKFTEKGDILLHLYEEADQGGRTLCFMVKDTGIGIAEQHLPSLFDAFFQVDLSHTKKYGGTGLGLTLSLRLAKIMGGRIDINSTLKQGSQFTLVIPCDIAHEQRQLKSVALVG